MKTVCDFPRAVCMHDKSFLCLVVSSLGATRLLFLASFEETAFCLTLLLVPVS